MRKEDEFLESLRKLNKRLSILEDCVGILEQRVATVEDMNRLNENKISKSLQELNAYGVDIKDLKLVLNSFLEGAHSETSSPTS